MADGRCLKTGMVVPQSGIYAVTHHLHRLPSKVALFKGESFPRCSKCGDAVGFEVIRAVLALYILADLSIPAALPELPVLNDGNDCQNR
jgi:hypothetical protein